MTLTPFLILKNVCIAAECQSLANPANGQCTAHANKYSDQAYCTCNSGYELVSGDSLRVCQQDGQWSGTDLTCRSNNIHYLNLQKDIIIHYSQQSIRYVRRSHVFYLIFCRYTKMPCSTMWRYSQQLHRSEEYICMCMCTRIYTSNQSLHHM